MNSTETLPAPGNTEYVEAEAPFVDPDGFPSWQPSPVVRLSDAMARRHREIRDELQARQADLESLQRLLLRAERDVEALSGQMYGIHTARAEALSTVQRFPDDELFACEQAWTRFVAATR